MVSTLLKVLIVIYVLLNALIIIIQTADINSKHSRDKDNLNSDPYFHDNRNHDELQEDYDNNQKTYNFLIILKIIWLLLTAFIFVNIFL